MRKLSLKSVFESAGAKADPNATQEYNIQPTPTSDVKPDAMDDLRALVHGDFQRQVWTPQQRAEYQKQLKQMKMPIQPRPANDSDKTKQFQVTPHPLATDASAQQIKKAGTNTDYESEGASEFSQTPGSQPWQVPTHGGWKKSLVPNTPEANPDIEDFSQQMEQDSPPAKPSRPLRPPPTVQPNVRRVVR